MNKKYIVLLFFLSCIVIFFIVSKKPPIGKKQVIFPTTYLLQPTTFPSSSPKAVLDVSKSIFTPYWTAEANDENARKYDTYYYFGVRSTKEGSVEDEIGYQKINTVNNIPEKQKKLVLRMLDASINEIILTDKSVQKKLIDETKRVMTENKFSGIVIDLEISFTLQSNKQKQITELVQQMCTSAKEDYKSCSVLIYGDVIYRKRPYDLKKISEYADTILLMAYDFHKAGGGSPGPNYSFEEKQKYGYDFKQMISDVTAIVKREKIEVVFGMFGYDWTLNDQNLPLKAAKALSLNEIQAFVANRATTQNVQNEMQNNDLRYTLRVSRNEARETSIQYTDEEGRKHVVWYEDEESAAIKTKYLQQQGINKISFWAYSYY